MTSDAAADAPRRPWPIWIVSGFWILGSSYLIWFYLAVLTGRRTVPILGQLGVSTLLGVFLLAFGGAIALLLLRRIAFLLFLLALIVITVQDTLLLLTTAWLETLGPSGITNVTISLTLYLGTTVYSWRLVRRGVLR